MIKFSAKGKVIDFYRSADARPHQLILEIRNKRNTLLCKFLYTGEIGDIVSVEGTVVNGMEYEYNLLAVNVKNVGGDPK